MDPKDIELSLVTYFQPGVGHLATFSGIAHVIQGIHASLKIKRIIVPGRCQLDLRAGIINQNRQLALFVHLNGVRESFIERHVGHRVGHWTFNVCGINAVFQVNIANAICIAVHHL